jgi:phosphate transport system permease protein
MVYAYAVSPYPDWHRQAYAAGFVLLMMVLLINVTARTIVSSGFSHKQK